MLARVLRVIWATGAPGIVEGSEFHSIFGLHGRQAAIRFHAVECGTPL
jgi:hypothetical protein